MEEKIIDSLERKYLVYHENITMMLPCDLNCLDFRWPIGFLPQVKTA